MKRRLFGILLCVVLVLQAVGMTAVSAAPTATVTVGTVQARPGDTVTVPVTFSAVEDLVGIELHLVFDDTVLEYVDSTVEGVAKQMDMATAMQAASAPNEVWLSGMTLKSVAGEGVAYTLTFRVKEEAPDGTTALRFADHHHMLLVGVEMAELPLDLKDGGVEVRRDAAPVPTEAPPTTTATEPPLTGDVQGVQIVLDEEGEPITRNDGQTVTLLPPNTVADLMGGIVTDKQGEAVRLPNVAVMVDQVTANPKEEVAVAVSLSPIADMTSLEISVTYDAAALTFTGGDSVGFVGDRLRIRKTEDGTVVLQADYTAGMSGDGDIAVLRFAVNDTARATTYRLGLNPSPRVMIGQAVLGVQPFAGEIRVLTDGADAGGSSLSWWEAALIALAVAAVAAVIVGVVLRRKANPAARKQTVPKKRTTDVSGDEE